MVKKNIESLIDKHEISRWLNYFVKSKMHWNSDPRNHCIEQDNLALRTKIINTFVEDVDKENYLIFDYNGFSNLHLKDYDPTDKSRKFDLIFFESFPNDDSEKNINEINDLFTKLNSGGRLIIFDHNCEIAYDNSSTKITGTPSKGNYSKFRKDNSFRLEGVIYYDTTFQSFYDDWNQKKISILILNKNNQDKFFSKLDFATNQDESPVHLISWFDRLFNAKDGRWWMKKTWNKNNFPSAWDLHSIHQDLGMEELGSYHWEYSEFQYSDNKYIHKNIEEGKWSTGSLTKSSLDLKMIKSLEIILSNITSIPKNYKEIKKEDFEYSAKNNIYSTSYLGSEFNNYSKTIIYPISTYIKYFLKKKSDSHKINDFNMILKFFEFVKIHPETEFILENDIDIKDFIEFSTDSPQEFDIVFSQPGRDFPLNEVSITDFIIEKKRMLSSNGKIIFVLDNRNLLISEEYKEFRKDFLPYVQTIIDFGNPNDSSCAMVIMGRDSSEEVKIIDMSSASVNINKLELRLDNNNDNIYKKSDPTFFKNNWAISQSLITKAKNKIGRLIVEMDEMDSTIQDDRNKEISQVYEFHRQKLEKLIEANKNILNDPKLNTIVNEYQNNNEKSLSKNDMNLMKEDIIKAIRSSEENVKSEFKKFEKTFLNLTNEVKEIKTKSLEDEEALEMMNKKVELFKDQVEYRIEDYTEKVKLWFTDNWDKSEEYTRTVLPLSEYLYESLIEIKGNTDFSSLIAYSSQALEIEFYQKIFFNFHKYVDESLSDEQKKELINYDKSVYENNENFNELDKYFHTYIKSKRKKRKYNLGGMIHIINYLPNDNHEETIEYSSLKSLQYLADFINKKMNKIDEDFMKRLEKFRIKRNNAAHPGEISREVAEELWIDFKSLINSFLSNVK